MGFQAMEEELIQEKNEKARNELRDRIAKQVIDEFIEITGRYPNDTELLRRIIDTRFAESLTQMTEGAKAQVRD